MMLPIGLMLLTATGFAIRPEDMEPNTWYDLLPEGYRVINLIADPDLFGYFYGLTDEYHSIPVKSTDEGKTWSVKTVGIDPEHLEFQGWLRSYRKASDYILYLSYCDGSICEGKDSTYLYKSTNRGESWDRIASYCSMNFLYVSSSDGALYIEVDPPGPPGPNHIRRSTDEGKHWETVGEGVYTLLDMMNSPIDPTIMYASISDSNTLIYWSQDNGLSWSQYPNAPGISWRLNQVVLHPKDPNTIVAVKWYPYDSNYPMKITRNGGATWEDFGPRYSEYEGSQMAYGLHIDPDNPDIMIATGLSCNSMYRTTDAGNTWTTILKGAFWNSASARMVGFISSPWSSDTLYLNIRSLLKSCDDGLTWSAMSAFRSDPNMLGWVSKYHSGLVFCFSTVIGFLRSTDYGNTWKSQSYPDLFVTPNTETVTESSLAHVIYYLRGGLCSESMRYVYPLRCSYDAGLTWEEKQPILSGRLVYVTASANLDRRLFGVVDNRQQTEEQYRSWLAISDDGGDTFREIAMAGSTRLCDIIDIPGQPNTWFALGADSDHNGIIYKTDDGGSTWAVISTDSGFTAHDRLIYNDFRGDQGL